MMFATAWKRSSSRKRRPRNFGSNVELLEVRSLLSSTAVILWQKAIKKLRAGKVLITDYPDQTRNQNGVVSSIAGPPGATLFNLSDAQFFSASIAIPLNNAIAAAATANHWKFVDIFNAFLTHGYPSTDTWIRQYDQSLALEGNRDGFFHPNAVGEQAIAQQLLAAYQG